MCAGANSAAGLDYPTPQSPALTNGAAAVSAGSQYSCALLDSGAIDCWGKNYWGELGNGTPGLWEMAGSVVPGPVSGLGGGVAAIDAGDYHACALLTTGGVKCWGQGVAGQLGDGSKTNSNVPVQVSGLTSGVKAIAAGNILSCALTSAGGVKCWGYYSTTTPTDVAGLTSGVTAIAVGDHHACAVLSAGSVSCWNTNPLSAPATVTGLTTGQQKVVAVAAGAAHWCALLSTGGVKCWGLNRYGQLGNGSTTDSTSPVDVTGLKSGVVGISAGPEHTCATLSTGVIKCWGRTRTDSSATARSRTGLRPYRSPA